MAYVIKRYANRKLYDPQTSRYVTLEELAAMIRAGQEIRVSDATTGEDLTIVVLAQIMLEEARSRRPTAPVGFLHQLIQYGEAWQDFARTSLLTSLEGVMTSQREADRILRDWIARWGWMAPAPPASTPPEESTRAWTGLKEEVAALRAQLQDLEARLDNTAPPKS